jgi:cytochrome c oxidase assembly protein Cox11
MPSQHSATTLDLFRRYREVNMFKKLLGAAAMAAVAYAVVPAYAAKMAGCSGENLEKTESATEAMADGAGKTAAQKEVAQANEALLGGKMGACAMHLSRAMHAGTMNQAPYEGTMNQAPAETTTQAPYQSQWSWKPIKPAL